MPTIYPLSSYELRTKPISKKELKQAIRAGEWVKGIVAIDLSDCFEGFETFLDLCSEALTGTCLLQDINYTVVGAKGNTLHVEVEGDPSACLD